MKNKFLIMFLGGVIILKIFASCEKFLDKKSDPKLVEIKELNDLLGLLDDNILLNRETTPGFGETSADDYFVLFSDYTSFTREISRQAYTWRVTDYFYPNDWSISYRGIYPANYSLDQIKNIPRTIENESQWDLVKGTALFHRAYRYLNLIWEFGKVYDDNTSSTDLGVVLKLNSDPTEKSVRASVKECYDQIITDARQAADYLPNTPQHVMRPSKPAAYGLLARAFLSMRKYDSAFKYANLCLQIKSNLLDFNSSTVRPTSSRPFPEFNTEIIFYTTQSQNYLPKNPFIGLIDTVLYNSYDANDRRKVAFFYTNNGYYGFKGTYSRVSREDLYTGISTAEMFLTRAECYAKKASPDKDAAMDDLNTLLSKRWLAGSFIPLTATDATDAASKVLVERRKELLMRGLRWIDIKRLNKEGANITPKRNVNGQEYTLSPNDDKYALPIPRDIIELTGMPQN
jgi:starch-binding outer membrane protein, SusD/RagB family